jgi:hypothetical protein
MRFPIWTVCLLLLSLTACDSSDDTGLEACTFTASALEPINEQVTGTVTYSVSSGNIYNIRMGAADGDVLRRIQFVGNLGEALSTGTYSLDPTAENGWLGRTTSDDGDEARSLRSTNGSLRFTSVSEGDLEGEFDMVAETSEGQVVNLEGAFRAGTFPSCRAE